MTESSCPTEEALDIAISVGADDALRAHLETCDRCRAIWDETVVLLGLARQFPARVPVGTEAEDRRTALLAAWDPASLAQTRVVPARPPRTRRALRWAAVGLAAAAVVSFAWLSTRPAPPAPVATVHPRRGMVHAHDGARFTLASQAPDEIVRLNDGVIDLDVDPLLPGERFRVVIGTDEVEVRGTSFEVVAFANRLVSVRVVHGRVDVRHAGDKTVVLGPGDAWHVAVASTAIPPTPPALPAPHPRVAPKSLQTSAVPKAPATSPQETVFVRGWDAMRQGDYQLARDAFDRAITLDPAGALAEDATFWRAVVAARLHHTPDAVTAFRLFIDNFSESTRLGEASAMLGWLLVETNELDEARRRFTAAARDGNASVRESAKQGLAALDARSTN